MNFHSIGLTPQSERLSNAASQSRVNVRCQWTSFGRLNAKKPMQPLRSTIEAQAPVAEKKGFVPPTMYCDSGIERLVRMAAQRIFKFLANLRRIRVGLCPYLSDPREIYEPREPGHSRSVSLCRVVLCLYRTEQVVKDSRNDMAIESRNLISYTYSHVGASTRIEHLLSQKLEPC